MHLLWLPNVLTAARILLAPFICCAIAHRSYGWSVVLFAIASATDFFDGYFARRLRVVSSFGAFFDPVADKLLMLSVATTYLVTHGLPPLVPQWFISLMVLREGGVVIGSLLLAWTGGGRFRSSPTFMGKCMMAGSMLLGATLMGERVAVVRGWDILQYQCAICIELLVPVVACCAIYSLGEYLCSVFEREGGR